MRKRSKALLAAAVTAAAVGLSPAAAQADVSVQNVTSCSFTPPAYSCSTGTLAANPGHWIKITAFVPFRGTNTCYLHDASNGVIVGQASRHWYQQSGNTVQVNGLYGSYFGVCVNSGQYGGGQISN
jgi:hypothetical protein